MGLVVLVVFLLIGPTPFILGVVFTRRAWSEHQREVDAQAGWVETQAVITECSKYNPSKSPGQWPYTYKSEWTDARGQVHPAEGSGTSCEPGQRYAIEYNPENPAQFSRPVNMFKPVPLILCLLGGGFMGIAFKEWRKEKAQKAKAA